MKLNKLNLAHDIKIMISLGFLLIGSIIFTVLVERAGKGNMEKESYCLHHGKSIS